MIGLNCLPPKAHISFLNNYGISVLLFLEFVASPQKIAPIRLGIHDKDPLFACRIRSY